MSPRASERKLAAILAADVVGYSRLMAADEESTVSRLRAYREVIDGLVAEGWVERVVSPSDRRVVHARLTPQGRKMAARLIPAIVDFMQGSCGELTAAERADLRRLLDKVRHSVASRERP